MPIHPGDGLKLGSYLRAWVALGHSPSDAAMIATELGVADKLSQIMSNLLDTETRLPPRGFTIVTASLPERVLLDGSRAAVLKFSIVEHPNPGYSEVRIL